MKEIIFMKGIARRLYSIVLALTMVISLMPINSMTAHAAGETGSATFVVDGIPVTLTWAQLKDNANAKKYDYEENTITDTSIGEYAFFNCEYLTSIIIPTGVTTIEEAAFDSSGLTSIEIPTSVTSIGQQAFCNCTNLTSITIPDSVKTIGLQAFAWSGLTSIEIPTGVTSIEQDAFYGCEDLTRVTIPNTVTTIGEGAFAVSGLTSIEIPAGVTSIEQDAFYGCEDLTRVTIPNTVTTIGEMAFFYCDNLTSVIVNAETPPELGEDVFEYCSDNLAITVPTGKEEAYKTDWAKYAEKIVTSHTHSLTYSLVGTDTIKAHCSNTETHTGANDVTLTLSASSANYSGNTVPATLDKAAWEAAELAVPTIAYAQKKEGIEFVAMDSVPTEAGVYKASVTVEGQTAEVFYEIWAEEGPTPYTPTSDLSVQYSRKGVDKNTIRVVYKVSQADIDKCSKIGIKLEAGEGTTITSGDNLLGTEVFSSIKAGTQTISAGEGYYFVVCEFTDVTDSDKFYVTALGVNGETAVELTSVNQGQYLVDMTTILN